MAMALARTVESLSRFQRLLILGALLWGSPALAQTEEVCSRTRQLLVAIDFATDGNLADDLAKVSAALKEPPGQFVASCVQLQEQWAIQNPRYKNKGQWFGFTPPPYQSLPVDVTHIKELYRDCKASMCNQSEVISLLLQKVCKEQLQRSDQECDEPKTKGLPFISPPPKLLPTWRKGLGGALIGVGGVGILLGSIHLGVPLFHTADGCIEYGLQHPCVADRFGVGGALLGVGLAAVGGGILALTLP